MRRVRYCVAMSLDGCIAGPNGEHDWIVMDPEIDFGSLVRQFDVVLMGRKTYEASRRSGGGGAMPGMQAYVCSKTLRQEDCPGVTVCIDPQITVAELRARPGRDIWLFGGGALFASLLNLGMVDTVEVSVIPVLLGAGVPLLPSPPGSVQLRLTAHRVYPKTGTVSLEYAIR